jgi:hypothetical protein
MRDRLTLLGILSSVGVLFLICYAPALVRHGQFVYRDAGNFYYPLHQRVQTEWSQGRWPLWEPEENAGMPLLGNPTAAVFYPGKLVFAVLPFAWASRTYVVAHSILAFVSMYLLMRSWGTTAVGSALSALSYAFGAPILFQACNVIYLIGAAWLPLGFRAVDQWLRQGRRWALLQLAVVMSMQVLGGDPQAAYLLGLAGIGYFGGLAWNQARFAGERLRGGKPVRLARARSLPLAAIVPAVWGISFLALDAWLARWRGPGIHPAPLRWTAWVPLVVNIAWGSVAGGFVVQWWRRGALTPLGTMWLGLAGAAALAAALAAVQVLPVAEFIEQTGRSEAGPHEIYQYTLDPCQLVELVWPNILGASLDRNEYWRVILKTPGGRPLLWIPSLYLGGLTAVLAIGSMAFRHGPPWRIWLTLIAGVSVFLSLGQYTSPLWLARALGAFPGSHAARRWLPDVGPLDRVDSASGRADGHLRDSDASLYWALCTIAPGFRQFRYPAKLFTLCALAMAALAGFGWDRACAGQARQTKVLFIVLIFLTAATLAAVIVQRETILATFRGLKSPLELGPFDARAGYRTIVRGLVHSIFVLTSGLFLTMLAPRRTGLASAAVLALMTADLAAANARYVVTVPQSLFDSRPEALSAIENAERTDPASGPFRIHRMPEWFPFLWYQQPSSERLIDVFTWHRDTLFPKYGINLGLEYTLTSGVAQLREFERFFASFYTKVRDKEAAGHLGVDVGAEVLYNPRRSFDMWNTRYLIVPFDASDWHSPARGYASFLFQSRSVYPDPARFQGPGRPAQVESWAGSRDFKVIRNLNDYPRSWVVHRARATDADTDRSSAGRDTTLALQEMVYAADPLWNSGTRRVYDPRNLAWVSRASMAAIRPYLSGATSGPSEKVTVTYPDPQHAVLDVALESAGLVILADVYYPGWELAIDGQQAAIYRVNGAMRGAAVSSGPHRLVFTYAPWSFRLGCLLSVAGLAVFLALCLVCRRYPVDLKIASGHSLNSVEKILPGQPERGVS